MKHKKITVEPLLRFLAKWGMFIVLQNVLLSVKVFGFVDKKTVLIYLCVPIFG